MLPDSNNNDYKPLCRLSTARRKPGTFWAFMPLCHVDAGDGGWFPATKHSLHGGAARMMPLDM